MINDIAYFQILGKPLIMWTGILTLISLLSTATIAILNKRGINKIPFKWHPIMARVTIVLGVLHGAMGILSYL